MGPVKDRFASKGSRTGLGPTAASALFQDGRKYSISSKEASRSLFPPSPAWVKRKRPQAGLFSRLRTSNGIRSGRPSRLFPFFPRGEKGESGAGECPQVSGDVCRFSLFETDPCHYLKTTLCKQGLQPRVPGCSKTYDFLQLRSTAPRVSGQNFEEG